MAKIRIHISKDKQIRPCSADKRACPLGEANHIIIDTDASAEEKVKAYNKLFEVFNNVFPTFKTYSATERSRLAIEAVDKTNDSLPKNYRKFSKEEKVETANVLAKYQPTDSIDEIVNTELGVWGPWNDYLRDKEHVKIARILQAYKYYAVETSATRDYLGAVNLEDKWKDRYRSVVAQGLAENGKLIAWVPSIYSWSDDSVKSPIVKVFNVFEDEWSEFVDTYAEPGEGMRTGYTAWVKLQNGDYRLARWETDSSQVLMNAKKWAQGSND